MESVNNDAVYKEKYKNLKRKLKFLIYENECYSSEIRNMEKRLLRILKDRTFLLDLLSQHESGTPLFASSDEDATDSSDGGSKGQLKNDRKSKKMKSERSSGSKPTISKPPGERSVPTKPRRKPPSKADKKPAAKNDAVSNLIAEDSKQQLKTGHMTPEEVERHLESRRAQQSQLEFSFAPDKAPATVPTEMFSNDMDGSGGFPEFLEDMETSPSNGDEHITLDLEHN